MRHTKGGNSEGFTIVEMVVSIVVISLFLVLFFQTYLVLESQRVVVARQSKASDIAYSNLRKFTTRPASLTCDSTMDMIADPNAPGKVLGDQTNTSTSSAYGFIAEPTSVTQSLGSTSTQKVVAKAPAGCAAFATTPVRIESTVTFGINGDSVVHASFVD